jgi:hypothetical protein
MEKQRPWVPAFAGMTGFTHVGRGYAPDMDINPNVHGFSPSRG